MEKFDANFRDTATLLAKVHTDYAISCEKLQKAAEAFSEATPARQAEIWSIIFSSEDLLPESQTYSTGVLRSRTKNMRLMPPPWSACTRVPFRCKVGRGRFDLGLPLC